MAEGEIKKDQITRLSRLELEDSWISEVAASGTVWESLEEQAQCLFLLKEYFESGKISPKKNLQPLPQIVFSLLIDVPSMNNPTKFEYCKKLNTEINAWLTEKFHDTLSDHPIVMFPLIPSCTNSNIKVQHLYQCEAKFASERNDKNVMTRRREPPTPQCPRGVAHCPHITNGYGHGHSHLWPVQNLPWWKWTLHELFQHAGLTFVMLSESFHLNNGEGDGLVNAFGGEINRLNEIRERCKCRLCDQRLEFNKNYSIKDAVYRATTTKECGTEGCSGPSVYLSHCRGCRLIIDSRDSKFRDENGFYLCVSCGSGKDLTIAGSHCPKCNSTNTMRGNYRKKKCTKCQHPIELPSTARRGLFSSAQEQKFESQNIWPK